jgi:hypothetical protein
VFRISTWKLIEDGKSSRLDFGGRVSSLFNENGGRNIDIVPTKGMRPCGDYTGSFNATLTKASDEFKKGAIRYRKPTSEEGVECLTLAARRPEKQ